MGTSLKVHGLRKLIKDFAKTVHSSSSSKKPCKVIFVNKTPPSSEWSDIIDYHICGETDVWTTKVINDWKKMKPADWEVQQTLLAGDGDKSMNSGLKVVKSVAVPAKGRKAAEVIENVAPNPEHETSVNSCIPNPRLSPGKCRLESSHYDDVESYPSKRNQQHIMPNAEQELLFAETTNQPAFRQPETDLFKSETSICDSSMRDVSDSQSSKMDISICDLSMRDVETVAPRISQKRQSKRVAPKVQGNWTKTKSFVDLVS